MNNFFRQHFRIVCAFLAVTAAGTTSATAQECPSACRISKLWFTEVTLEDAVTEFVDGYGPSIWPPTSVAGGSMHYSLTPTAEEIADLTLALASSCPVEVRFWTRGQLLRSGKAEAGYSAHLETRLVSPVQDTVLSAIDLAVSGPPTPNGNYPLEHVVPLENALVEGDSLTMTANATASAFAVGSTTRDYGSAYFKMYRERVSGAPLLQMCVP
jgi:hypothetical protein